MRFLLVFVIACGSGDGGGKPNADAARADAKPKPADAKVFLDAPGSMGLGKICFGQGTCPATFPHCLQISSYGFCTKTCAMMGQEPDDSICSAGYTSTGMPACFLNGGDGTLLCGIRCGAVEGPCPSGLTCDAGTCL